MDLRKKNFTVFEKKLLPNVLLQYKDVIENNKTDAVSMKTKIKTWEKVAAEFNSTHGINEKVCLLCSFVDYEVSFFLLLR